MGQALTEPQFGELRLLDELRRTFGFASFRPLQQEIIEATLAGRDVLALLPTGGGKSLCYQLPALIRPGLTIVVSPLIALMKDQVDKLKALGVAAGFINSSLTPPEVAERQAAVARGALKLLYVAPERLMMAGFLRLLSSGQIACFAIDEAHCISEWGHDFRPEYRELTRLRELFPSTPISAFTATATRRVQADIVAQLRLDNVAGFRGSFDRANLFYRVLPKQDTYRRLLRYLKTRKGQSGIVYCLARNTTESIAEKLKADGFRALAYHAGLDAETRRRRQEAFIRDEAEIVVATIAFGMGIDKPDVRFVVHYDLPKNLEGYYQESGRAGRDGEPSDCILFYSYGDAIKQEYFIEQRSTERERQFGYQQLRQIVNWADSRTCRRRVLLRYFDEELVATHERCCDLCSERARPGENAEFREDLDEGSQSESDGGARAARASTVRASNPQPPASAANEALFQRLRQLRKRLADERSVSAFVIFYDSTLRSMAAERPATREQLLRIAGVTERKLLDFGELFLSILAETDQPKLVSLPAARPSAAPSPAPSLGGQPAETVLSTLALFRAGEDVSAIANRRGLKPRTVHEQLARAIELGENLDINRLVAPDRRRVIEAAVADLGPALLKPLKERLGDGFSYDEIRIVQALALRKARGSDGD